MKYLLNTLLASYIAIIFFAGMPEINEMSLRVRQLAGRVSMLVGLWPSWSMFAPNPLRFDNKTYVVMSYKDGKQQEEDIEVPLEGPLAPFRSARWTKFAHDNLRQPNQRALLPGILNHFYHRYNAEENPILFMKVIRKISLVPPIDEKNIPSIFNTPRIKQDEILLTHKVR